MKSHLIYALIATMILGMATAFSGCKKDKDKDEPQATTVTQDKQNIQTAMDGMLDGMESISKGEGMSAMNNFLMMQEGVAQNEEWIDTLVSRLDQVMDLSYIEETNRFEMEKHTGTYTWNVNTEIWSYNATPQDKIILLLPESPASQQNNLKLTFSGYADQQISVEGEEIWIPVAAHATIALNGEDLMALDLHDANWSDELQLIKLDVSLFLKPITFFLKQNRITPTHYFFSAGYQAGSGHNFALSLNAKLAHDDINNLDPETDIKELSGDITMQQMRIAYLVNAANLLALDEPTTAQLNENFNITIFYNEQNIGTLNFVDVGDITEIHIVYKDGSSENFLPIIQPFIDELMNILSEYLPQDFKQQRHHITGTIVRLIESRWAHQIIKK